MAVKTAPFDQAVYDFLVEYDEPATAKTIAAGVGLSPDTVERSLERLMKKDRVRHEGLGFVAVKAVKKPPPSIMGLPAYATATPQHREPTLADKLWSKMYYPHDMEMRMFSAKDKSGSNPLRDQYDLMTSGRRDQPQERGQAFSKWAHVREVLSHLLRGGRG